DQGTAEYRLGTPSLESALMLPRPRISQSGPMAVIGSPDPGPMGPDSMGPDSMGPDPIGPDLMSPDPMGLIPAPRADYSAGPNPVPGPATAAGQEPDAGQPATDQENGSGLQPASAWSSWRPDLEFEPGPDVEPSGRHGELSPDVRPSGNGAVGDLGDLGSPVDAALEPWLDRRPSPARWSDSGRHAVANPESAGRSRSGAERSRPAARLRPVEDLPPIGEFERAVGFRAAWDFQSDTEPHPVDDLWPVEDLRPLEDLQPEQDPRQGGHLSPVDAHQTHPGLPPVSLWSSAEDHERAAAPQPAAAFHPASDWKASRGFELAAAEYQPAVDAEPAPGVEPIAGVDPAAGVESIAAVRSAAGVEPIAGLESTAEFEAAIAEPTAGVEPVAGLEPTAGFEAAVAEPAAGAEPTVGLTDASAFHPASDWKASRGFELAAGEFEPTAGFEPSAGGFNSASRHEPDDDFHLAEPLELASIRPAADLGATTVFQAPRSDEETAQVLEFEPRAGHRRARPRPERAGVRRMFSGRPGTRMIILVMGAVVGLVLGITALIGFGKSLWSTPDNDVDTSHNAAPTPPPLASPPVAPPTDPAAEARDRAKRQADAAKRAAQNAGAGSGSSVLSLANCTKRVSSAASLQQAVAAAAPGQKICATGNMGGSRLQVSRSGTPAAPITVIGNGSTPVKGITVDGNNVVVAGFSAVNAEAPGIELTGNNITVRNNTVKHPTGGDFDGLRFFGSNLKILDNTISDISPDGSGAHADCMQSYATDPQSPASQNVLIDGNRCERIDNQCLIAEGPNSSAGDGSGQGRSDNITFTDNFCDVNASQALQIDDIQNVKVTGNTITGKPDKAFSFQNRSTGAVVAANKIAAGIGYQVGMDASSLVGYRGPSVGGEP
ncbi:MAG: hypothetical protein QOD82_3648, partial [Pseudonocardiales bacterium]|nr:hypothetical protein [Pseudonocardiales bacterium]